MFVIINQSLDQQNILYLTIRDMKIITKSQAKIMQSAEKIVYLRLYSSILFQYVAHSALSIIRA
jgi:hypothetical protein